MPKFTHLHVHTHYSLLDGLPKIDELVKTAKGLNMDALAITDHGVLHGVVEFYKKAKKAGVKPILGIEAYVAPRTLHDKEPRIDSRNYHMVLLARNEAGYRNLMKLTSEAWLHGFYYRPRIDKDLLRKYGEGLVGFSGCPSGEIPSLIKERKFYEAERAAYEYQDIFGKGNFFIEVQWHPNNEDSSRVFDYLISLADKTRIPLVATQDVHYLKPEDAMAQDVLVAIQTGNKLTDPGRLTMTGEDYSLRTPEAMAECFKDYPKAIENTQLIADMCDVKLPLGVVQMPRFPLINEDPFDHLSVLVEKGADARAYKHPDGPLRVRAEMDVIRKTGFAEYFLVVRDIVRYAQSQGINVSVRGSAAGSLVAYLTGITEIDPLKYDLLFERFLTPDRINFPDIDLDFPDRRRDEIFQYLKRQYGEDKFAQIITFGTMASRAAIRDVGRALDYPYGFCDQLAKIVPFNAKMENVPKLPEVKLFTDKNPQAKRLLEIATRLEGVARHASMHACGVVLTPTELTDHTPLQFAPQEQDRVITQYDMRTCEDLGLLKIDVLGLRNLTIIEEAKTLAKQRTGETVAIDPELADKKTYDVFQKGETVGVFQLEKESVTRFLRELKPDRIADIIDMVSLNRPGPMAMIPSYIRRKFGKEEVVYLHPKLKPILESTYGIAVYQEQLMRISQQLAGFTPTEADTLRKAVGKKIKELLDQQKQKLIQGMIANGIKAQVAAKIWEWIEPFASYGFNKAHAAMYALIAYETAYLKAHYPLEFMTALFDSEGFDLDRVRELIGEAKRLGFKILPPDVNKSRKAFTPLFAEHAIIFGLGSIKSVGHTLVEAIDAEREHGGIFASFDNFLTRVNHKDLNKKSLESLIKAGVFDVFEDRATLLWNLDTIIEFNAKSRAMANKNTLFGVAERLLLKKVQPATLEEKLKWEKEFIGIYLSGHPLERFKDVLKGIALPIDKAISRNNGKRGLVKIAGLIQSMKKVVTKNGEPMAFLEVEDLTQKLEVTVFPKTYLKEPDMWREGRILLIEGELDERNDKPCLILRTAEEVHA